MINTVAIFSRSGDVYSAELFAYAYKYRLTQSTVCFESRFENLSPDRAMTIYEQLCKQYLSEKGMSLPMLKNGFVVYANGAYLTSVLFGNGATKTPGLKRTTFSRDHRGSTITVSDSIKVDDMEVPWASDNFYLEALDMMRNIVSIGLAHLTGVIQRKNELWVYRYSVNHDIACCIKNLA